MQILYLDSLDTREMQIPGGIPRVSAWSKELVNKVLDMDMKKCGSFGKCLWKNAPAANVNSTGASTASAIFGGVQEIANLVKSNVSPGPPQKKKKFPSCTY